MEAKRKGSKEEATSSAKSCNEGKIRTKKSRQICHLGRLWCPQKSNGCHQGAPLPPSRRDLRPRRGWRYLCAARIPAWAAGAGPLPALGRGWEPSRAGADRHPNSPRKIHFGKVGARVAGVLGLCPSPGAARGPSGDWSCTQVSSPGPGSPAPTRGAELGQTFATFVVSWPRL